MVNGDFVRHGNMHGSCLLFIPASHGDEAIFHPAIGRVFVCLGTGCSIDGRKILVAITKQRAPHRLWITHKCNAIGTYMVDITSGERQFPIVLVNKNCIAAYLIKFTNRNLATLSTIEHHCTTTVNGPV
jgi:hypothetical protein